VISYKESSTLFLFSGVISPTVVPLSA
jgi:hypothetical protein